ncbi:MAG: hypothetical protein JOZ50_07560 [Candidatus Eremiobacteraeota bacterium]|nr:hypothetical protein [Candidatus Eremiobacteraeota bacterium]
MKRMLVVSTLVAVAFATLNIGPIPAARAWGSPGCNLGNVAGSFGFSYNGVGILPTGQVPVGAVGKYHADSAGNLTGDEINSLGGDAEYQTIVGNITVTPDCSGTLVAKVYQGGVLARTSYIHLQYQNNTREVLFMFQKLVLPNGSSLPVVINGSGKRIFSDRGD